ETAADVDDASILARPLDHLRAGRRQLLEMQPRGFVGAVLRPHHREDAEFDEIGLAAESVEHMGIFRVAQAMLSDDVGRDHGAHGRGDSGLRDRTQYRQPSLCCLVSWRCSSATYA